MGIKHGKSGVVRFGAQAVGHIQSWNIDVSAEVAQGYSMGDGWQSAEGGVKSWSGSVECYYDPEDAGQISAKPGDKVELSLYPVAAGEFFDGSAVISGKPVSGSKDGFITLSFNFTGDGELVTTPGG